MSSVALGEERIDTAVGKVQVWRAGTGAPIVYLHSAMGEGPGLAFLEELAGTNDVVAPVFPGFGESEGIGEIDDMEDAVFHVLDLLDQLGLDAVPFVGLSLGGWMAAEVATRYPERAQRLVLVNPAGLVPARRAGRRHLRQAARGAGRDHVRRPVASRRTDDAHARRALRRPRVDVGDPPRAAAADGEVDERHRQAGVGPLSPQPEAAKACCTASPPPR